jgi:hypothetical protein
MKADPMDSIHLKVTSPEKTMMSPSKSPTVMRRFALFVDGMARAMILPFGPSLVFRLVHGTSQVHTGSSVPIIRPGVAICCGTMARCHRNDFRFHHRNCQCVARLGGAALSLHILPTVLAASVSWLVVIRFLSATLAGLLCGITNGLICRKTSWRPNWPLDEDQVEPMRRKRILSRYRVNTAKIYLTGFAVSILSGGLLFRKAAKDSRL